MKRKVFVSYPIAPAGLDLLQQHNIEITMHADHVPLTQPEFIRQFQNHDAVIMTLGEQVHSDVIELALRGNPPTKIFSNYGVGYNNIDVAYAKSNHIFITNTPDVLTDATADAALLLMLAVARRFRTAEHLIRAGKFQGWSTLKQLGVDLNGKTLGIVGFGRIGQAVAFRAKAFGMEIIYTKRTPLELRIGKQVSFETLLRTSDVVSVHTPLTGETVHLFSRREFEMMKPNAILINTSRGAVIDEKALVVALREGKFFGVGLDVYEQEPHVSPELFTFENVVLLPHIGAATTETRNRMSLICAENILDCFNSRTPRNLVY
ncbi:MAG: D-glycerate dehydrogenase [Rhizobacter sp.]|nr:D-glycerate dehydrogenase [Chlorobiales bacterium]